MSLKRVDSGPVARLGVSVGTAAALMMSVGQALADEPRRVNEPDVLSEPAEITQVVDAFDGNDLFDFHISLGYQVSYSSAKVRRESFITQAGFSDGGYTSGSLNAAEYSQTTQRLNTRADLGLYHDLGIYIRLPIILNDSRKLEGLDGSENYQRTALAGMPGEQLFSLPFQAPNRSGLEYLALGIEFAIMNQWRDSTKPTWVVGLEGRFNVSEPMHACNKNPKSLNPSNPLAANDKAVECAHTSDYNRNGRVDSPALAGADNRPLEGNFSGTRTPGVSRGTTGLVLQTYLSKRIKYIEPYGGFKTLFEFQHKSSDYGSTDLQGALVNHPPLRGTVIMGLAVIPWEVRDRYQRLTFDLRMTGTYISEGRDYSELFDALGSSDAPSLRTANYSDYMTDPLDPTRSVVNPTSQRVYFSGLTDVQQHLQSTVSGSVTFQAGEYVKFNVGLGYRYTSSHLITFDQACNPDFKSEPARSGPCRAEQSGTTRSTGIPNPAYRAVLNAPGQRFRVDGSYGLDGWASVSVMF